MAKIAPKKYEVFEAGVYEINRVEFFTTDDSGDPIYITQETKYGIRMVARYRTYHNDDEGPPGSIGPEDLALFVKAFGVDPGQLPSDNLQALSAAERLIASADKTVTVNVGDSGWIRYIQGMSLPEGKYLFKYIDVNTRDENGEPAWREGDYGTFATVSLEVVKNADGSDSPYKGSGVTLWLRKEAFSVIRALAPVVVDGMLGPEETELVRLDQMAVEADGWIYGEVGIPPNGKKPKLLAYTLLPVGKGRAALAPTEANAEESLEAPYIEHLYTAIAEGVDGAFTSDGGLSDAGKKWCGANLRELCKEYKIPNSFDKMSQEQVVILLNGIGRNDLAAKAAGEDEDEAPDSTADW